MSDSPTPLARLLGLQSPDGGFGAHAGLPSSTEASALAALALSWEPGDQPRAAAARAGGWLSGTQLVDGGWPSVPDVTEASWATGLAVIALARFHEHRDGALRGGRWLLGREGRRLGIRPSLLDRLFGRPPIIAADDSLVGWPWVADTYSWIEPTSYAILGLETLRGVLPADDLARRIDLGRRMIRDRACPDGGWNYGNAAVYGQGLWGYPDTTAIALLALRGADDGAARAPNLDALQHMLDENKSGLATSLGILALDAYGRNVEPFRSTLRERFAKTSGLGEVRTIALAVLALNGQARPFGGVTGA